MKIDDLQIPKYIKGNRFWLLGLAVGLGILNLNLAWHLEDIDRLSINLLAWACILLMVWNKRDSLHIQSSFVSSILGTILVSLVLFKSLTIFWFESGIIRILLLGSFLGIALIASGIKGLRQYKQEFIILAVLLIPEGLISSLIEGIVNVSLLTAKLGTLILWYSGFEVTRQGVYINLASGSVEVYPGCSGLSAMVLLLRLSVIYLIVFKINSFKAVLAPIAGILIAYLVNGFRVALMAFLVAFSNRDAFEYWHLGNGSQIFAFMSVLIFGLFCSFILTPNDEVLTSNSSAKQGFKAR